MRHVHLGRLILALALLAAPAAAQQYLAPVSDVSCSGWLREPYATTNMYLNIDEGSADGGTTYIWISGTTATASCEVKMGPALDPVSNTQHWIAADFFVTTSGSCGTTVNLDLMQGTTVIATHSVTSPAGWGTWSGVQLTTTQADSISDYGDLRLRFRYTPSGKRCVSYTFYVTWGAVQIPSDPRTQRVMQVQ